ncbi:eotaxin-like isoform X2 [Engraulis encrasicolus]|uniref:eotaxin-like isoform X2 n=1 Tax=Engraulis encrasicolus TaxID=184585 RepID=UPI002FCE958D
MELKIVTVLCCFTLCLISGHADNTPVSNCPCPWLTKTIERIPLEGLQSYTVQRQPPCLIKAIWFRVPQGLIVCSDPESRRTRDAMEYLDKKTKRRPTPQPPSPGPSYIDQTTSSPDQNNETMTLNPTTTPTVQHKGPATSNLTLNSSCYNRKPTPSVSTVNKESTPADLKL